MNPNFALFLSFDGIRLLHRTPSGWTLLGQADVQDEDLGEALSVLRKTASGLAPDGVRSKLVIPNDQIRYLSLETPGISEDARRDAARAALEGATPYAVDELVFDIHTAGDITQVAAVARETLEEAEAFAVEHRLHPVSFVAAPDADIFDGEPFFGPTSCAAGLLAPGEQITPDSEPVNVSPKRAAKGTPETNTAITPQTDSDPDEDDPLIGAKPSAEFVSVRRVPTFRSNPVAEDVSLANATAGQVPDFGEPHTTATQKTPQDRETGPDADVIQSVLPAPAPALAQTQSEEERLTVFGARSGNRLGGRMRQAGVLAGISAAALVIIFAMNGFVQSTISSLFDAIPEAEQPPRFAEPLQPELLEPAPAEAPEETAAVAEETPDDALPTELTDEDAAVLEALREPTEEELQEELSDPAVQAEEDALADYAVTGIWTAPPDVPSPPPLVDLEDFYVPGIDPINPNFDAVALPDVDGASQDEAMLELPSPAPAGTEFNLNERGLVVATPDGALNPDGVRVFAGPPPVRQPDNMPRIEDPGEDLAVRLLLSGFRPKIRPDDLIETSERATLSGLTRAELGALRPRLRPQSAQESARAASLVRLEGAGSDAALIQPQDENDFDGATARAVAASLRPDARPNNFSAIVARVQRTQQAAPKPPVTTASAAPRAIAPSIPSSASVSREATVRNGINLRKVNLIGVYGKPSSRRALVRLSNGSYRKVQVGDRIDGGLVSAIGDSELRYQKSGRAIVLKMPRG